MTHQLLSAKENEFRQDLTLPMAMEDHGLRFGDTFNHFWRLGMAFIRLAPVFCRSLILLLTSGCNLEKIQNHLVPDFSNSKNQRFS